MPRAIASARRANAVVPQDQSGWMLSSDVLHVKTRRPVQFVDITDRVASAVRRASLRSGLVSLQTRHTTTGLAVNEHEPRLLHDLRRLLERFAPAGADYRHDDLAQRTNVVPLEPRNGHAHGKALVLRASETIHVVEGRLQLGRWQRIFLVELDGARTRELSIMMIGAEQPAAPRLLPKRENGRHARRFRVHPGTQE
jgi:secondary thiamine-phosphate synthase enzyme